MALEADPQRVARLAAEREDENWQFRAFLKWSDLESAQIDAVVHRHYAAVAAQIDCCRCGNCCTQVLPVLEADDVQRLAAGLALSRAELARRFLVGGGSPGSVTFRQKPCPLLQDGRCSAYQARPEDCRSFPHLDKEGFVFRLIQAIENCAVCPIVYHVMEAAKAELWRRRRGRPRLG